MKIFLSNKQIPKLFLFVCFIFCVFFNMTLAQNTNTSSLGQYKLLEPINFQDPSNKNNLTTSIDIKTAGADSGFNKYINDIFMIVLILIVLIAIFRLMYGGVMYLTKDIGSKVEAGKKVIVGIFSGLFFILLVWLIFFTVNPRFMEEGIIFSPLKTVTGNTNNNPNAGQDMSGKVATKINGCDGNLVPISANYNHLICSTIRQNLLNMIEAAKKDGIKLTIESTYRTSDSCDVSRGTCADNGKSNHQKGLAIDFSGGFKNGPSNHPIYVWLKKNASNYNFYNLLVGKGKTDEYNHWSTTGN